MATAAAIDRMAVLEEKIDALTDQVHYLAQAARDAELRRAQWDELRTDLTPIVGEAFEAISKELDDVREFVQPEDFWRLAKRVARNTDNLELMFEQLEAVSELGADLAPLSRDVFLAVMERLDDLERKGYFTFAASTMGVLDRVVTSFSEEDVEQLGDNIVLILETIKEMTQPEVMGMLRRTALGVRGAPPEQIGLFQLMWRMRQPAVRRGLGKLLNVLESFSEPEPTEETDNQTTE